MGFKAPSAQNKEDQIFMTWSSLFCMRKMGLEPTRRNRHKILSLARLPIPTLPRDRCYDSICQKKKQ